MRFGFPFIATQLTRVRSAPSTDKRSLSSSSSVLSDLPEQPPAKRRKISPAGEKYLLGDDDEDDEDEPLATRIPFGTANKPPEVKQRAGKSLKMKGLTAPVSVPPPTGNDQEQMNGNSAPQVKELRVKIEDQMDESQITRLVTGVTVDTSEALATTVTLFTRNPVPIAHTMLAYHDKTGENLIC